MGDFCSETWTERGRSPETGQLPWSGEPRKAGSTADRTPGGAGAPDKTLSLQGGSEHSTLPSPALISVLPSFVSSAGSGPEWGGLSSGQWGIYDLVLSDFIRACPSSLTRSLLCCWVSWICGWTSSSEVHHPRALCHLLLASFDQIIRVQRTNTYPKKFRKKMLSFLWSYRNIDLQQHTIKPQTSENYKAHSSYYNPHTHWKHWGLHETNITNESKESTIVWKWIPRNNMCKMYVLAIQNICTSNAGKNYTM